MKFKDLPPAERLRVLRSEGGYVAWMREQARAPAASAQPDSNDPSLTALEVRVPAAAVDLVKLVASALRSGDVSQLSRAALAVRGWRPKPTE